MKRVKRLTALIAVAFSTLSAGTAMAATDGEIQTAIGNGLGYLSGTQTMGGYWNYGGYEQAATGSAAYAMMTQQAHWGDLAAGNVAAYKAQVDNAIAYLLNTATTTSVSTRNDGANICPGGGSCTGVYWYGAGETTYTTGLIAPAIAEYATRFGGGAGAVATNTGPLAARSRRASPIPSRPARAARSTETGMAAGAIFPERATRTAQRRNGRSFRWFTTRPWAPRRRRRSGITWRCGWPTRRQPMDPPVTSPAPGRATRPTPAVCWWR